jgi:hypothetical protein
VTPRVKCRLYDLHVLLRHRPRSISPTARSEQAGGIRRGAARPAPPITALADRVLVVDFEAVGRAAYGAALALLPQDPAPPRLLTPARAAAGALAAAATRAVASEPGAVLAGLEAGISGALPYPFPRGTRVSVTRYK